MKKNENNTAPRKKTALFCCENSAFKAAGPLRGTPLFENVIEIKATCAGKVEALDILKQVEAGAERVIVAGCPLDNCRYVKGNKRAAGRVELAKRALAEAGYDEGLVRMEFLSSLDAHKLAAILADDAPPTPGAEQ